MNDATTDEPTEPKTPPRTFVSTERAAAGATLLIAEMQGMLAEATETALAGVFGPGVGVTVVLRAKTALTGDLRIVVDVGEVDGQLDMGLPAMGGLPEATQTLILALDSIAGVNADPPPTLQ